MPHASLSHRAPALAGASVALVVLTACASGAGAPPPDGAPVERVRYDDYAGDVDVTMLNTHVMSSDSLAIAPDDVWSVLPKVYEELGIPIRTVDPVEKMMGNRSLRLRGRLGGQRLSRFLDCGTSATGANADGYEVILDVLTTVVPTGGGTTLRTRVTGTGYNPGNSGLTVRCVTTGALERQIANRTKLHSVEH